MAAGNDRSVTARGLARFHRPMVAQSLVRSFQIEMLNILLDYMPNVAFAKEDHAIETFSLGILYPGLGVSI